MGMWKKLNGSHQKKAYKQEIGESNTLKSAENLDSLSNIKKVENVKESKKKVNLSSHKKGKKMKVLRSSFANEVGEENEFRRMPTASEIQSNLFYKPERSLLMDKKTVATPVVQSKSTKRMR